MLVFFRVHILAGVTSLSVTPSSAGLYVLDEHCMPDRDRIPHASIHYLALICKRFVRRIINLLAFLYIFHVQYSHSDDFKKIIYAILDEYETIYVVGRN